MIIWASLTCELKIEANYKYRVSKLKSEIFKKLNLQLKKKKRKKYNFCIYNQTNNKINVDINKLPPFG